MHLCLYATQHICDQYMYVSHLLPFQKLIILLLKSQPTCLSCTINHSFLDIKCYFNNIISLVNQPLPFLTIRWRGESGHNRHCSVFCWNVITVSRTLNHKHTIVSWLQYHRILTVVYAVGKIH